MSNVFIESADLDISDGENFAFVKRVIPDVAFIKQAGVSTSPAMNIVLKAQRLSRSVINHRLNDSGNRNQYNQQSA